MKRKVKTRNPKTILLLVSLLFLFILTSFEYTVMAQDVSLFYYGTEGRISLQRSTERFIVKLRPQDIANAPDLITPWGRLENQFLGNFVLAYEEGQQQDTLISSIRTRVEVLSVNPIYLTADGQAMGVTDIVLLKFKSNISEEQRQALIQSFGATDITNPQLRPYYTKLSVPKNQNTLSVANQIFESGLVDYSHPDFLAIAQGHHMPNDEFFSKQFYFHNTGQVINDGNSGTADADIDAPEAWDITKGSSAITIAVIDEGVTTSNNDLPSSRLVVLPGSNFAGGDPNDPNPVGDGAHGTACAGIIAAEQDNNEGISGLAPLCRIMPVRIPFGFVPASTYADAIDFAWMNGADVLSNSWGYFSSAEIPVITDAIDRAATLGRGGIGSVVVFSAGNTADHNASSTGFVTFPSNAPVPSLLCVGASDRNDQQANYSPDGNDIDVVAPSHLAYSSQIAGECFEVWTTDIPGNAGYNDSPGFGGTCPAVGEMLPNAGTNFADYTARMGGTSAACPQVAGLAALLLSGNPALTPQQVHDCITNSAEKVGGYTYTGGRSMEMGFGRINAFLAVGTAPTITCPADITVDCDLDPSTSTGEATAVDDCDPTTPSLAFQDQVLSGDCEWECTIERTWTATDLFGNESNCTQTITKNLAPLIDDALNADLDGDGNPDPFVLGITHNTFTIPSGKGACILDWLPGTGTSPDMLPRGNQVVGPSCNPGTNPVDGDGQLTNTLLVETLELALYLRLDPAFGETLLTDLGCTIAPIILQTMGGSTTTTAVVNDLMTTTNNTLGGLILQMHRQDLTDALSCINGSLELCAAD